jgi:hypothetical protein
MREEHDLHGRGVQALELGGLHLGRSMRLELVRLQRHRAEALSPEQDVPQDVRRSARELAAVHERRPMCVQLVRMQQRYGDAVSSEHDLSEDLQVMG